MKQYFVEGLIRKKSKEHKGSEMEVVNLSIWAQNQEEALREAEAMLGAADWVEGPRLRTHSEEQRMRKMGIPELPGLLQDNKKKAKKGK